MRRRFRRLTPEQRAELHAAAVARVRAGEPIAEVSRDVDAPVDTIRLWCTDAGLRIERRVTDELKAAVVARVRAGARPRDIADELGVSQTSVWKWGREAGCIAPRRSRRRSAPRS
jgi:transposase-like protein